LLWRDSVKEEDVYVSSDFFVWFLHGIFGESHVANCTVGHGDDDPDDPPTFQEEVPPLSIVICFQVSYFLQNFLKLTLSLFWSKLFVWNHPPQFNIAFMGKSTPTYVVSTYVAGFEINYDVTFGDYCTLITLTAECGTMNTIIWHVRNPLLLKTTAGLIIISIFRPLVGSLNAKNMQSVIWNRKIMHIIRHVQPLQQGVFFNGSTAPWGPRPPHFSRLHDHTF
jgi:hypothetical protein